MSETKYLVRMDGTVVAENMRIEDALLLIKALANEYYNSMHMGSVIELTEMDSNKSTILIDEVESK